MGSASKNHLGVSAAPVPLLIKGAAFERLADTGLLGQDSWQQQQLGTGVRTESSAPSVGQQQQQQQHGSAASAHCRTIAPDVETDAVETDAAVCPFLLVVVGAGRRGP